MKRILVILFIAAVMVTSLTGQKKKEPYYWEVISNPGKTLDFTVIIFHKKFKWVESSTEGNYSVIPLFIKNKATAKRFDWKDYKVFILSKNGDLMHNYKTVAKKGDYACNYLIEPGKSHLQLLCFGKKLDPNGIDRIWIKMTSSNFIKLQLYRGGKSGMSTEAPPSPGEVAGFSEAQSLLNAFLRPGADYAALTQKLKPTRADYQAYFKAPFWKQAMTTYEEMWNKYPFAIKPNTGQSKLLLWGATVSDIQGGRGFSSQFPGGYKMVIGKIESGHTIFRFKFVEPGKRFGMAFDGLVKVNGRWVIFPKPWRVFQK